MAADEAGSHVAAEHVAGRAAGGVSGIGTNAEVVRPGATSAGGLSHVAEVEGERAGLAGGVADVDNVKEEAQL